MNPKIARIPGKKTKVSSLEYIPKDKVCYLEKAVGESVGAAEI